ncbi:MAG: Branched-chain alpha-keto acid dehydrogenase, component, alpha subunit protein [Myxococcaceae bacterium]|nr:Branched-chain alpha-keto acid dehydrogenase, component, alpha subunit protein [Myxococcaceae bacterium]
MHSASVPGRNPDSAEGEAARDREQGNGVTNADLVGLYTAMLRARRIDHRLAALYREGAIGTHRPAAKDEAVIVGATAALRPSDWLFSGEGHLAAALVRGVPVETMFHHLFGDASDPTKGRTVPSRLAYKQANVIAGGTSNGAHLTHAAGLAWAAKIEKKNDVVALALFDATVADTGEFHNGLNFAGVFKAPAIFVCRSTVDARAPAGTPLVERGVAYGMRAVACDGGDVAAVLVAVRDAIAHAAGGGGPTLIDAVIAADADDPLLRTRRVLEGRGLLTNHAELEATLDAEIDAAVRAAIAAPPPDRATLFEDVYAAVPRHLQEQAAERKGSV